MCGIAGIFSYKGVSKKDLKKMTDIMAHRGPDGEGVWISRDKTVGLGHRRLAILDLSEAARQPMSDGPWHLVFNGEIYNHAEIRKELEEKGVSGWKTSHSDTEVLLKAFQRWGTAAVLRFKGIFAFAIYNEEDRKFWLVRDRVGVKPLYYVFHGNDLYFASEIKALFEVLDSPKRIDLEALDAYLSCRTVPGRKTLFQGIDKLPPASILECDIVSRTAELSTYWDPLDALCATGWQEDVEFIVSETKSLLKDSVRLRKVSDVPVGIFLSGGLDSSLNAVLFAEGEKEVKTFSIGYDRDYGSYQNELAYAERVAKLIDARYYEKKLSLDDLIESAERVFWLQDEPLADPVCFPVYHVSKLARENGVTVCQVGEGSDELFWGYPWWTRALRRSLMARFFPKKPLMLFARFTGRTALEGHATKMWRGLPPVISGSEAFIRREKDELLTYSSGYTESFFRQLWKDFKAEIPKVSFKETLMTWMSYSDLKVRLPELLLMRVDKMSMGVGLEARVPFLDHRLVEFAMSVRPKIRVSSKETKWILKKAAEESLPKDIVYRKKQGFGVPVEEWLAERLGKKMEESLDHFISDTGLLDFKKSKSLIEKRDPRAWLLYNLAEWYRIYF